MSAIRPTLAPRHIPLHRPFPSSKATTLTHRPFSTTSPVRAAAEEEDDEGHSEGRVRARKAPTRHRRRMYSWLNGPGRAFASPRPGSTNYLSAYTREGQHRSETGDRQRGVDEQGDEGAPKNESRGREEEAAGQGEKEVGEDGEIEAAEGKEGEHGAKGSDMKEKMSEDAQEDAKRPFPLNEVFKSEPVLSEPLREEICARIGKGDSVSKVSAEYGVDMRRVAAVVRLKAVERRWAAEGKPLAMDYANAVAAMLPQTELPQNTRRREPHESINDLPVHASTQQQIFWPTSESRQFTRADAARVFSPSLLPADERIAHPELIAVAQAEKEIKGLDARGKEHVADAIRGMAEKRRREAAEAKERWEKENVNVVKGPRWDFRFESINGDDVGKDGRAPGAPGWRYGVPYEDRKRGHIKGVPLAVET